MTTTIETQEEVDHIADSKSGFRWIRHGNPVHLTSSARNVYLQAKQDGFVRNSYGSKDEGANLYCLWCKIGGLPFVSYYRHGKRYRVRMDLIFTYPSLPVTEAMACVSDSLVLPYVGRSPKINVLADIGRDIIDFHDVPDEAAARDIAGRIALYLKHVIAQKSQNQSEEVG